jgi:hypothetical protein
VLTLQRERRTRYGPSLCVCLSIDRISPTGQKPIRLVSMLRNNGKRDHLWNSAAQQWEQRSPLELNAAQQWRYRSPLGNTFTQQWKERSHLEQCCATMGTEVAVRTQCCAAMDIQVTVGTHFCATMGREVTFGTQYCATMTSGNVTCYPTRESPERTNTASYG